jgi:preprotein translocase subunit SecB
MRPSPLQLHYLFFEKLLIEVNPAFVDEPERSPLRWELFNFDGVNFDTTVEAGSVDAEDAPEFAVTLNVSVANAQGKQAPYHIDARVTGFFTVAPDKPDGGERVDFVVVNGTTLLYGAIREQVTNITCRSARGPLFLPTVNFLDLRKAEVTDEASVKSL